MEKDLLASSFHNYTCQGQKKEVDVSLIYMFLGLPITPSG